MQNSRYSKWVTTELRLPAGMRRASQSLETVPPLPIHSSCVGAPNSAYWYAIAAFLMPRVLTNSSAVTTRPGPSTSMASSSSFAVRALACEAMPVAAAARGAAWDVPPCAPATQHRTRMCQIKTTRLHTCRTGFTTKDRDASRQVRFTFHANCICSPSPPVCGEQLLAALLCEGRGCDGRVQAGLVRSGGRTEGHGIGRGGISRGHVGGLLVLSTAQGVCYGDAFVVDATRHARVKWLCMA